MLKLKRLWLNEEKTIKLTIEHWEWIRRTGGLKEDWGGFLRYTKKVLGHCFLCEHAWRQGGRLDEECADCLLVKYFGKKCSSLDSPYLRYPRANTFYTDKENRKEVAEECLVYLRNLRDMVKEAKNVRTT